MMKLKGDDSVAASDPYMGVTDTSAVFFQVPVGAGGDFLEVCSSLPPSPSLYLFLFFSLSSPSLAFPSPPLLLSPCRSCFPPLLPGPLPHAESSEATPTRLERQDRTTRGTLTHTHTHTHTHTNEAYEPGAPAARLDHLSKDPPSGFLPKTDPYGSAGQPT